jgi:hypothetical protein
MAFPDQNLYLFALAPRWHIPISRVLSFSRPNVSIGWRDEVKFRSHVVLVIISALEVGCSSVWHLFTIVLNVSRIGIVRNGEAILRSTQIELVKLAINETDVPGMGWEPGSSQNSHFSMLLATTVASGPGINHQRIIADDVNDNVDICFAS